MSDGLSSSMQSGPLTLDERWSGWPCDCFIIIAVITTTKNNYSYIWLWWSNKRGKALVFVSPPRQYKRHDSPGRMNSKWAARAVTNWIVASFILSHSSFWSFFILVQWQSWWWWWWLVKYSLSFVISVQVWNCWTIWRMKLGRNVWCSQGASHSPEFLFDHLEPSYGPR